MGDFIVFRAGDDSIRGHIPSEPAKLDTPYREWALNVEDAAAMWTEAHYDDIGRPPEVECVPNFPLVRILLWIRLGVK